MGSGWWLTWVLIVELYSGDVEQRFLMSRPMENYTACVLEARLKEHDLESMLGSGTYHTEYYGSPVSVGGKIIGYKVLCRYEEAE